MSLSTLPDIFKRSQTIQPRVTKQGPSYSLHLNTLSPQKHVTSRAGYAPDENKQSLHASAKSRAMSTQQMKSKETIMHEFSAKRNGNSGGRMKVTFKEELELSNSMPLRQKLGMTVMNITNFPYENRRSFNNNTIELEQSENLNKKIQALTKEAQNLQKTMSIVKQQNNQCKSTYFLFCRDLQEELQYFNQQFEDSLKQCYKNLSSLRRQTNEQIKSNRIQFDKLKGDINTCSSLTNDFKKKTSDLYSEYVKTAQSQEQYYKDDQLMFDFQEISSIRKSSRGATGDVSRRTKRNQMPLISNRKSEDLKMISGRENKFVLNGKEIDLLNFEEQC